MPSFTDILKLLFGNTLNAKKAIDALCTFEEVEQLSDVFYLSFQKVVKRYQSNMEAEDKHFASQFCKINNAVYIKMMCSHQL